MSLKRCRLVSSWCPTFVGLGYNQRHGKPRDHECRQHCESAAPPNLEHWAENRRCGFELQLFSALLNEKWYPPSRSLRPTYGSGWFLRSLLYPQVLRYTAVFLNLGNDGQCDAFGDVISTWLRNQSGQHRRCSDAKSVSITPSLYRSWN